MWLRSQCDHGIGRSKTFTDAVAAIPRRVNFPSWLVAVGGPNAVLAGDTITVTRELTPGNYLWICFDPDFTDG